MPSIYTHTIFAKDVKKGLAKDIKSLIQEKEDFYLMFSQSFDNLYYYNFLSLHKGSSVRALARYAHNNKTNEYFSNIITYIKENNLEKNPEVLSYLYGAINHYIADSHLHPYINYRTGRFFKERKKETRKYIGIHTSTELSLDAYYYEKETKQKFKNYKIYKELIHKLEFSQELKDTIDYAFLKTFNKPNMGNIYNKSYNQSKYIYQILMYDPYGFKNFVYKTADLITPFKSQKIATYSLYKEPVSEKFFNREHNDWCNPVDMDLISTDSWDDVFKKAVKKATELISLTNDYFNNKIAFETLIQAIGNNSYSTGFDVKDRRIPMYFEF